MKVVYVENLGVYEVELPHGRYEVNGYPAERKIQVKDKPEIYRVENPIRILCYEDKDTGEQKSVEDFNAEKSRLLKNAEDVHDPEGPTFPDLDSEFEYRKFRDKWRPVTERHEERTPVEYDTIYTTTDTGDEFIESGYSIGEKPDLYYFYALSFSRDYFKKQCEKYGLSYDLPDHSGIRFAKIGKNYPFGDDVRYAKFTRMSWEQIIAFKNKIKNRIDDIVKEKAAEQNIIPDEFPVQSVEEKIGSINNLVSRIESKQKTENVYRQTRKEIRELIEQIKQWKRSYLND